MSVRALLIERDALILKARYEGITKQIPRIRWNYRKKIAEFIKNN